MKDKSLKLIEKWIPTKFELDIIKNAVIEYEKNHTMDEDDNWQRKINKLIEKLW